MISPLDVAVRRSPLGKSMVKPLLHGGVSFMSLGYVSPTSGVPGSGGSALGSNGVSSAPAILRGPMASKVVVQLLKGTDWGTLDVLLLDLPPGTGDVPLTVCQEVSLDGAVAVTTPGRLALADVIKGVTMFEKLGVRTLAAVENMSHFTNPTTGVRHYLLGGGGKASDVLGGDDDADRESRYVKIPMSERVSDGNDKAMSVMERAASKMARGPSEAGGGGGDDDDKPETWEEVLAYRRLASAVVAQLFKIHTGAVGKTDDGRKHDGDDAMGAASAASPSASASASASAAAAAIGNVRLAFDEKRGVFALRVFSKDGAKEVLIKPEELRRRDPKTGGEANAATITEKDIRKMLPIKVCERKGNYAYSITWGNGATIIYSMECLMSFVDGAEKK